ncbi:dephospho-CoA kinase [Cylindrospermopsis raciborskii S07]|uniref:Dephospho-CoA kinase n=3 Tax=Cylindrospermopsis raciborskii TaxID=77022 RepID=A0A853MKX2_9CYAN|nr:dephospho-CoA kinase [Cylindrospermopsis raciborskii]EFA70487.1 Dephospho-CoA kinase [Cylindrospermopsis raciborskii CS-505]MBA4445969.1 dephospho-CoA kinase [Cylindrospermopsis raciborskii CS-506_C]MBA4450207.1 dephospho-CoA kinase [Cylindrospermopsis raciborskii CS-506_D]MBA4456827.1 dephospho-CoA kinase [Cylindrospermopsis raciborskii CS-506_B]MBA4466184.1 dephospho-CoA kinase [Cylindrospermopsis raciborskii CS-506_A]
MTKRLIGLTGGIATGKSTVANYLASVYGLPILDADIYARDAVSESSVILSQITQRYGKEILLTDGNLNRKKLAEIIFNQSPERSWVENLIHPYVRNCFLKTIEESPNDTLVLVIPLLFEAGLENLVNEIWVVYCQGEIQKQRLMSRNDLTEAQAMARINSQLPLEEKVARADVVLDNSSDLESLLRQVDLSMARFH